MAILSHFCSVRFTVHLNWTVCVHWSSAVSEEWWAGLERAHLKIKVQPPQRQRSCAPGWRQLRAAKYLLRSLVALSRLMTLWCTIIQLMELIPRPSRDIQGRRQWWVLLLKRQQTEPCHIKGRERECKGFNERILEALKKGLVNSLVPQHPTQAL